jgi:hypothetical protein
MEGEGGEREREGGREGGRENQHVLFVVIVILDTEQIVEWRHPSRSIPPHLYTRATVDTRSDTGARHVMSPHGGTCVKCTRETRTRGYSPTDRQTDRQIEGQTLRPRHAQRERERERARTHPLDDTA